VANTFIFKKYEIAEELIKGRLQKVIKDRPRTLNEVLSNAVARYGDKEAFISGDRRMTFKELSQRVDNFAQALQKKYGVMKGDRVALIMGTDIEFLIAFFAVIKIGGIIIPLNTRYKAQELSFEINNAQPSILILDREFWEVVEPYQNKWESLHYVIVNGEVTPPYTISFDQLLKDHNGNLEDVPLTEDDTVMFMYTSGTTGHPKGAVLFHRGIIQACMTLDEICVSNADKDKALCVIPMVHAAGIILSCIGSILMGISCVLLREYTTQEVLEIIEKEKITTVALYPVIILQLIHHPDFVNYDLSSWRSIIFGGSPKSPSLVRQIRQKLPYLEINEVFGMTETHTLELIMTNNEIDNHISAVGMRSPLTKVKIVDEQGNECPPNVAGELLLSGSKIISSYWKNTLETKRLIVDGWLHTGDLAKIDEQGFIYILDRKKDVIYRGEDRIYSLEVENVLYTHPKVMEAAIIGIPDEVFGEQVKAFIVLKSGEQVSDEELKAFCNQYLAEYKVPKYVEFLPEMPRNSIGNILKKLLR